MIGSSALTIILFKSVKWMSKRDERDNKIVNMEDAQNNGNN